MYQRLLPGPPRPDFCPRPSCRYHNKEHAKSGDWYYMAGSFHTKCRGDIQRFRCKHCGKYSSTQTFSFHYWTHSTANMQIFEQALISCMGCRQLARAFGHTYRFVQNRIARLARAYIVQISKAYKDFTIDESCSFDGFESYLNSQYFPMHFHILMGSNSQIPFGVTSGIINRKGRKTPRQEQRCEMIKRLWPRKKGHYKQSIVRLFRDLPDHLRLHSQDQPWVLFTDEHPVYPEALRQVPELKHAMKIGTMEHITISSLAPRTRRNPLFPSNYIDRELRKNSADHVRETVRQAREIHMAMCRMVIHLGHHMMKKPHRIPDCRAYWDERTHAEMGGFMDKTRTVIMVRDFYTKRNIWDHIEEKHEWMEAIWKRGYENPPIIDFVTGTIPKKGQPGNGFFAGHLLA